MYDLLQDPERNKNLRIRENKLYGIFVEGLAEFIVENIQDCFLLLSRGETNRAVRQTRFNHQSSRSHTIFQLLIESDKANKRGVLKKAKINFCDLAGSEKYDKDNKMVSEYVKELTQINKSLSTLGKVISALGKGINNHVPYRDSKLTRLLQDSLGVNTRTILIATISPAPQYVEESISTLKFADRAKQILVKLKKNEISATNDQVINKLQKEIQHLKTLLNLKRKGGLQELEQKIWTLTEENNKLKTLKQDVTVEEVERLKEENKKLRIELQHLASQGDSDGFFIPAQEYSPKSATPNKNGSRRTTNIEFHDAEPVLAVNMKRKNSEKSENLEKKSPKILKSMTPNETPLKLENLRKSREKYSSPISTLKDTGFRSNNSYFSSEPPKKITPDNQKRMNIRYKMNNFIVEDGGFNTQIKETETRIKEMKNIQARLNKITEIENYRKEQFRKELKNLEENRKKEEEDSKKKSAEESKKRKQRNEVKKQLEEFKKNKQISEELQQIKMEELKRDAENKRKMENSAKKKKLAEFYDKKKTFEDYL